MFNLASLEVQVEALRALFTRFEAQDDVFALDFTRGGVLLAQIAGGKPPLEKLSGSVRDCLTSQSSLLIFLESLKHIAEGPYFLKGNNLHEAWRLYEDELCSFVSSVVPADAGDPHE